VAALGFAFARRTLLKHFAIQTLMLLGVGLSTVAQAQFTFTLQSASKTTVPGGNVTFTGIFDNTVSPEGTISLDGLSLSFPNGSVLSDYDNGTLFMNNATFNANNFQVINGALFTENIFQVAVANNTPDGNYSGSVTVNYRIGSDTTVRRLTQSFTVQSTPTPPVILVTLLGGIGTVRMALRRRK
jgi:hypothetical protein